MCFLCRRSSKIFCWNEGGEKIEEALLYSPSFLLQSRKASLGRGYFIFGGDKRKERLNAGEKKQRRLQLKKSATKMLRDPPFNSEIASPFLKATKASGLGSTFFRTTSSITRTVLQGTTSKCYLKKNSASPLAPISQLECPPRKPVPCPSLSHPSISSTWQKYCFYMTWSSSLALHIVSQTFNFILDSKGMSGETKSKVFSDDHDMSKRQNKHVLTL